MSKKPVLPTDDRGPNTVTDERTMSQSLLVGRIEAALLCGVSTASWDRLTSSGRTPNSIRLGGRVLWRRADLASWIRLGCPDRQAFQNVQ